MSGCGCALMSVAAVFVLLVILVVISNYSSSNSEARSPLMSDGSHDYDRVTPGDAADARRFLLSKGVTQINGHSIYSMTDSQVVALEDGVKHLATGLESSDR